MSHNSLESELGFEHGSGPCYIHLPGRQFQCGSDPQSRQPEMLVAERVSLKLLGGKVDVFRKDDLHGF